MVPFSLPNATAIDVAVRCAGQPDELLATVPGCQLCGASLLALREAGTGQFSYWGENDCVATLICSRCARAFDGPTR